MALGTAKKHGTPNWTDCATNDLGACEQFYATVFGWTADRATASDGESYSVQRLEGEMVAGIYELNQQMRSMGVSPHWGTYIEVDDVDATLELVKAQGGTVRDGPFEEPEVGRFAIIQDPVGAYLRLWHSAPQHGGEVFNVPGAMIWNELNTKEPEKAAEFYAKVLGVEIETLNGPTSYTILKVDGRPVAGILRTTPEMGECPPSWDVYFASSDVDDTARRVVTAGGKALREPFDIPGVGRMAVLQDPQGAVFEVIKMEMTPD
jgi:predicted enzyme related to lactoylglutathione lyase